ncbi:MAG: hypothetical protein MR867_02275 [Eubacterium sp.]|nr:hypothetical protein [Eubacterium sp.]MDD7210305.1 hypothetical protein [Lachnospiraceae bacterium]MDY5496859.1 hypothetical protein [Anaerobutyricum sp.]
MKKLKDDTMDTFLTAIEERLAKEQKNKIPFSRFLEEKMDAFDYSNTSLARKVFHRVEKKKEGTVSYVPVTRQAIGSWLRGSMPSSREIYVTLGMAFEMNLEEINHILLETYMGYGLYCKNIEDALWIALINRLFPISEFENVKKHIEEILEEKEEESTRSLATMDLWVMLSEAETLEEFYDLIRCYRDEFRDGAKKFGQCLEEVIEEEYGYYEKAAWFLRDIGCMHCEAQFSKIKAGKAIVTREWLLRFCIALQPTYESIEKLLAKAQMEPLGITPAEVIIEMISRFKSSTVANSQEVWHMIESAAQRLRDKGYEMDEDLCRKYNSVYELPAVSKWWFSFCIGRQLLQNEQKHDYGYEKNGYCRFAVVDQLLFDDMNRNKKNLAFKQAAKKNWECPAKNWREAEFQEIPSLFIGKNYIPDALDLEKFSDYCYMRRPSRFSADFLRNDVYFYCALLYSVWTGRCFQKDNALRNVEEIREEFLRLGMQGENLVHFMEKVFLSADTKEKWDLSEIVEAVAGLSVEI